MLNSIVQYSIKNKFIVSLFVLTLIGYGIFQLSKFSIDAIPDVTNNQLQIITSAPSYGTEDIERFITMPIEQATSNIPGIIEIRSYSRAGLSLVTIVFKDELNIYWARQQVAERLQNIQSIIPTTIGIPQLAPVTTGLGEIYQYVVKTKPGYEHKYDETELRTIQDWMIRKQLLRVPGIADVSSFGGKIKTYELSINPTSLNAFGISIIDIFTAVEKNNQNTGGSYIEKNSSAYFIRSEGLIKNINDIKNIFIKTLDNGASLHIKDVAEIKISSATRYGALTYNDEGEVTGGIVLMLKGENSNEVITVIKEKIKQIEKTLPEGVIIEPFLDRSKMINSAIRTVIINLLEGALIVLLILILFLGNIRAGLLVASVIPLSMLFAIIMMNLFGVSGNLMSLGALDFGLIVDGAIIIVEAVLHKLHHNDFKNDLFVKNLEQDHMNHIVYSTVSKIINSSVFGQIIILVVYMPIFFLQNIEGKMFKPMVETVSFALIGSFILSITYIPMMSSWVLNQSASHNLKISDKIMFFIERMYLIIFRKVFRHARITIAGTFVLFIFSLVLFSFLGGEFIPTLEEGDFAVETRILQGSNLNVMIETTQKASRILKNNFPEIEKVITKIGSSEIPIDPMPMEAADMIIVLKDKKNWTSAKTYPELAQKMQNKLDEIPGITTGFQYPVQMRFNELMTGGKQDVLCKIFGENLDTLTTYAKHIGDIVQSIDGAKDLYVEPITGSPQIIITFHRDLISQYRLNIEEVNTIIQSSFAGRKAGVIFENEKRFDLIVRLHSSSRSDLSDVQNLLIPISKTEYIPLRQIANVDIQNTPNQIQRENTNRRITVGFNIRGKDIETVVQELEKQISKKTKLPSGYYITYGGVFEKLKNAKQRLWITVPISLFLIFLLLYFAFHSFKYSLLIYSAIPLSIIGGVIFLFVRDIHFSISAGVGFIVLFGVAVLNGIILITELNYLKQSGMKNMLRVVLQGSKSRLRPVLMTASVASLGFFPMALSSSPGSEVQKPLATVVIGGLLIATFLTLFIIPMLYLAIERKSFRTPSFKKKIFFFFFVLIFFASSSTAQIKLTIEEAKEIAYKNNLVFKSEQLKTEYQEKLMGSYLTIPQTNIYAEYGQINGANLDTKFTISQTMSFPIVYSNYKNILQKELDVSKLQSSLSRLELNKIVYQIFYQYLYLKEKEKLLFNYDSIYTDVNTKTEMQFAKGEITILDKSIIQFQKEQIDFQVAQLKKDLQILYLQLKSLLNVQYDIIPTASFKINHSQMIDSTAIGNHISMQIASQQIELESTALHYEYSRFLPDLTFTYNNASFDNLNSSFASANKFHSVQIGIGVPIFWMGQESKINAIKVKEVIAKNNYSRGLQSITIEFKTAYLNFTTSKKLVDRFEDTMNSSMDLVLFSAYKQMLAGNISFTEFIIHINQVSQLQMNYLDAVKLLNESIIQLNYLTNQ